MKYRLTVNGFEYEAEFTENEMNNVIVPLLKRLTMLQKKLDERLIVFMAAPPAVGKSTLAIFMEKISKEHLGFCSIQQVSLDGFHHKSRYLKETKIDYLGQQIYLNDIKGMPETFDLNRFEYFLKRLKEYDDVWPSYDRKLHDVVDEGTIITEDIILIEGNWLLLNEEHWKELINNCDYSIFIEAKEDVLKNRLINRKQLGGLSYEDALSFYERSDKKNIQRVLSNQLKADLQLSMLDTGEKVLSKN